MDLDLEALAKYGEQSSEEGQIENEEGLDDI